ncbi:MAG TPA: hypothetical protein VH161_08165 [Candidatus Acidoferrales bacterium]|jgi:hypothetical protein|nr:hypothetical protein [Candidatus Acidoferrales bacterium]
MEIPGALSERFPFLDALEENWEPVSRAAFFGWLGFYIVLIANALVGGHLFQWFDLVFVPIHEGGHLLFRMFGEWIAVAGGTFLQLFVSLALAANFALRRQAPGAAFCTFFFFEQFLPIATYMADARAQELPLLTVGDSEDVIHDWNYLFSHAGLLAHDTQIAATVRVLGWAGMFATVAWFSWRSLRKN